MDYEEKYKEALESVRKLQENSNGMILKKWLWNIFPELKESEDEKIRKRIIHALHGDVLDMEETNKALAWLEKQVSIDEEKVQIGARKDVALSIMNFLDRNTLGMCLSNMECADLENAVVDSDWSKVYDYMKKKLEKKGEQETLCDKCRKEHPSGSCQDITALGRCSLEHEQKSDNSYCQENCKGFQETGKCFADGDCKAKREAKSIYDVKPKFKVGDWICNDMCDIHIASIENGMYYFDEGDGLSIVFVDEHYHLWTIQDARDGDVLFHSDSASNGIFIFKEIIDKGFAKEVICYCDYDSEDHFCLGEHHTCCWTDAKILYPATKEQRDLLFTKMKEAGYTFDFEKKELKELSQSEVTKISDQEIGIAEIPFGAKDSELQEAIYYIPKGFHAEINDDKVVIKKGENPTAWSEEDETRLTNTIIMLKEGASHHFTNFSIVPCVNWLKSLKQRIGG